jgi:hypothetical protein
VLSGRLVPTFRKNLTFIFRMEYGALLTQDGGFSETLIHLWSTRLHGVTQEDHGLNIHRCKQLPEWRLDGGSGFLRYFAPYLPNYKVSHPEGHKFNEWDNFWTKCYMCGVQQIISSSVGRATSYGVGFRIPVRSRIFSSKLRPDRLWRPHRLLSNVYLGLFPRGKAAGAWSWPPTST